MLNYALNTWADGTPASGKYSTLEDSRANSFRMTPVPEKRLSVAVAAFEGSGRNFLKIVSSGHEIDVTDESSVTFMLPTKGAVECTFNHVQKHAQAGGVLVFGPSRRKTRVVRPDGGNFEAALLKFPVKAQQVTRSKIEDVEFGVGDPHIPTTGQAVNALTNLIDYIFFDLRSKAPLLRSATPSLLVEALVAEHVQCLLDVCSRTADTVERVPVQKVREAEEFMRAHYSKPLRIGDIAAALQVGMRQLQSAFHETTGMTPWARLTLIRLDQARLRLLSASIGDSVTTIALDCGFSHLGRFSQAYRRQYGENPSDTLRTTRLRAYRTRTNL